ncbi:MAG: ATP-binding protein [Marinilabiliales bacterium]|jgi:MinD superfamily P-loop ATPase
MKEIVVISGKGGTGKTSITASLAVLAGNNIVVADCDVDAADMHLLLNPDFAYAEDFYSGQVSIIHQDLCIACGKCLEVCRFEAVLVNNNAYSIDTISCEGCGYCSKVCPVNAIENLPRLSGKWFISNIKTGSKMVHAQLDIGADNSGKLVAKVKNEAKALAEKETRDYIIVDGSPGIGCPVVSSLSGANFVVFVIEPTVSGLHDLKRVYQVVKKFNINSGCIINKYDINLEKTEKIIKFLHQEKIIVLGKLPYDENFIRAMVNAQTIVEYNKKEIGFMLKEIWEKIKMYANK